MQQTPTSKKAQEYLSSKGIEERFDINARYHYSLPNSHLNYEKLYETCKEGDELINFSKLIVNLNLSLEEVFNLTCYFFQQYPDINENWVREISFWSWWDIFGLEEFIHMQ